MLRLLCSFIEIDWKSSNRYRFKGDGNSIPLFNIQTWKIPNGKACPSIRLQDLNRCQSYIPSYFLNYKAERSISTAVDDSFGVKAARLCNILPKMWTQRHLWIHLSSQSEHLMLNFFRSHLESCSRRWSMCLRLITTKPCNKYQKSKNKYQYRAFTRLPLLTFLP